MGQTKKGKDGAIEFVQKLSEQKENQKESINTFTALLTYAKSEGYDFQKEELIKAFKELSDRYLTNQGIPTWVIQKMPEAVRD